VRPLRDMDVIQIEITNACVMRCSNCTRLVGHSKPFFMELDFFKKAVDSLLEFPRMIGIMGGEPLLHPQFTEMAHYLKEAVPDKYRRGLWSVLPKGKEHLAPVVADVFGNVLLNDHTLEDLKHSPVLVAAEEVCQNEDTMWYFIDKCPIQLNWSASITPKGAFFCEVAASLDEVLEGPGGWEVEPGWWKRNPKDFVEQMERSCRNCGVAMPLNPRIDVEEIDDVSPRMLERLKELGSSKVRQGNFEMYNRGANPNFCGVNDFRDDPDYPKRIAAKYGLNLRPNHLGYYEPFLAEEAA